MNSATRHIIYHTSHSLQDNTLQVVLATDGQVSFVLFLYSNIEWGFANIGFNAGDGMRSFMVPGALTAQSRNIENGSNVDIPGLYVYRVDRRIVVDPSGEQLQLKITKLISESMTVMMFK